MSKWTPIFVKGSTEFVVPYGSIVGDSEDEAWKIAMGVSLVEGIMLGFKPTGRYLQLDDAGVATVTGWPSKLGAWDIVILDTQEAAP